MKVSRALLLAVLDQTRSDLRVIAQSHARSTDMTPREKALFRVLSSLEQVCRALVTDKETDAAQG